VTTKGASGAVSKTKTVRSLGLRVAAPPPDCWRGAPAITLTPRHTNKRPENARKKRRAATSMEHRGSFEVTSISYLPTTFTTLFILAAGLLLGYIQ
jgi:hypothetical protein